MSGKDIKISFSGQPYLQAGFIKKQLITLPPFVQYVCSAFYYGIERFIQKMGTICTK